MAAPNFPSSAQSVPNAIPGSGAVRTPDAGSTTASQIPNSGPAPVQQGSQGPQLLAVQKPKGGGAIQSIGEKFTANPATGTAALSIPLPATQARPGGTPSLSLSYSSGSGNGPFGIGWSLNLGAITRRVSKKRPQYEDARDSDVFILQDEEDLVPTSKQPQIVGDYSIRRYRPRSEGTFTRIERVTHRDDLDDVHWRVTSRDNVLSVYGRDDSCRIQLTSEGGKRIFSWLLCETYHANGNVISYMYKSEDDAGVVLSAVNERNRTSVLRGTQRYIKSIRYGNKKPMRRGSLHDPTVLGPALSAIPQNDWTFELVFDYGDHSLNEPTPAGDNPWLCRQDPFSAYRPGFEVRMYRLCRRVLMFHRFPDELGVEALLVNALELKYSEQPTISLLICATSRGYVRRSTDPTLPQGEGLYYSRTLPPLEFGYTPAPTVETLARSVVKEVDRGSLENLPEGVSGSSYQWLDLLGEGLAGVLATQSGSWLYKRNLSARGTISSLEDGTLGETVTLGPMQVVDRMPNINQTETPRFVDLSGNGRLDVVDMTGPVKGFYRGSTGRWDEFRTFRSWPLDLDIESSNTRFIDLTGDGLADVLITEDQVLTFHESLGYGGYGAARSIHKEADEERGPRVLFSDVDESVIFADMSGDGTSDLCRVRNGEICYWPNLGYGRFGTRVTMNDSPYFDRPEAFSQKRILMLDVDGSGTTDMIYLGPEGVTVHFNNSGNGWAKPQRLPPGFLPPIDTLSQITCVDIMGNGTGCLVWSSSAASESRRCLRYIDFNNGIKPHLLVKMTNNIGKETSLSYLPSTTFFLRDELHGVPWVTRLPFPVQCLERVRTYDAISRSYHTTRYAYHHGYFDGHDREFRGFGMVDQWDTEIFDVAQKFSPIDVANVNETSFSPPVLTKRWYHTGAYENHQELQKKMARQFSGAADLTNDQFEKFWAGEVVKDRVIAAGQLRAAEARDASRALKGSLLHEEVYALDDSPLAHLPHRVVDYGFDVKVLQRHGISDVSVCQTYQREQISHSSEREAAAQNDGRVQHGLTIRVDDYGNILNSVQVFYGRAADFATVDEIPEVPFESPVTGIQMARQVMAKQVTCYRRNDLEGVLKQGQLESMALEGMSYTLALTPEVLARYSRGGKALISNEEELLHKTYKYERLEGDDTGWWLPTARTFYHADSAATPAQELESAMAHFFTPLRIVDPYGFSSTIELDTHALTQTRSTDAVGNVSSYVHCYRDLKLILATDPNNNRSAFKYDCVGRLVASAVMGKSGEHLGDNLDGIEAELSQDKMADFAAQPLECSSFLLKGATVRYIYGLEQYRRENNPSRPVFAATLSRETHVSDLEPGATSRIAISFSYFDGLGRDVQTKGIAEQDPAARDAPRWVGSAWKVLNNKGDAVRVFNPFFDKTHAFKADWKAGVSPYFMYDALGRLVATAMPNKTWTKVEHGSWETRHFDANDTVLLRPDGDPDVGSYFSRLPREEYLPTWHEQRKDGAMGAAEKKTAEKTALHNNTPKTVVLDSMGNQFLDIEDNGNGERFVAYRVFDAKGLARETRDAKGRLVERKSYDVAGNRVLEETMDSGRNWMLRDAMGLSVLSWRGKGQRWKMEYDALGRVTHKYLLEEEEEDGDDAKEVLYERRVYGETEAEPAKQNLRGEMFRVYDQAGTETNTGFNFKGELVTRQRQLAVNYSSTLDWNHVTSIALERKIHVETTHTNAHGQITYSRPADGSALRFSYNTAGLPEKIGVNFQGEKKPGSDEFLWADYVTGVEYNEFAFATTIFYGNGQRTVNDYDKVTLLLKERQTLSSQKGGTRIQDAAYTYDPSGNITCIANKAQQDVFFRNRVVSADVEYTYDPTYRLIESSGREQLDQKGKAAPPGAFGAFENDRRSGDPLSRYVETYKYDSANNILSVQHRTADEKAKAWTRTYKYEEASALETGKIGNRLSSTQMGDVTDHYGYGEKGGEFGCLTWMPHLASMTWDSGEQLRMTTCQRVKGDKVSPERTWYVYDHRGTRVRKVTERQEDTAGRGSATRKLKEWAYLGDYDLYRKFAGDGVTLATQSQTLHVHGANEGRLALIQDWSGGNRPGRQVRYQVVDHLDAVSIEVDESGQVVSYEEYSAYGSTTYQMEDSQRPKRFRWASKERDKENGFYYCEARYYASWLGRWISADPAGTDDDLNVFAYVSCRPTQYSDPTGLCKAKISGRSKKITKETARRKALDDKIKNNRRKNVRFAPIPGDATARANGVATMTEIMADTHQRLDLHHNYPQENMKDFLEVNLNAHAFTTAVSKELHHNVTFGHEIKDKDGNVTKKLGPWNTEWKEKVFHDRPDGFKNQLVYDFPDENGEPRMHRANSRWRALQMVRKFAGKMMADYGLCHLDEKGESKFLDYKHMEGLPEWQRSLVKAKNIVDHENYHPISPFSLNAGAGGGGGGGGTGRNLMLEIGDPSSISAEKQAAIKLLFGDDVFDKSKAGEVYTKKI
ncbi:putative YD repeat protein [Rhypophila decipiens]|uniref:YD repeat protein n=1 Tax=Rhypophila decipiens TaxID=261697 RepID=A0AAN7AZG6_9PEZI|nr:putative YD repeat protein [Rhypophila decipiens]